MRKSLRVAIAAVTTERGGKFDEAFDAAELLVAEYGEHELAERVVSEVPDSVYGRSWLTCLVSWMKYAGQRSFDPSANGAVAYSRWL